MENGPSSEKKVFTVQEGGASPTKKKRSSVKIIASRLLVKGAPFLS